ncbi:NAD(P)-binding protein [Cryphonectria parasitica EP155]|uniref:NAD(P)-binding protein n=1 Tax=Cryphonectria parasitica (strain ATCC 38755 / EP155) TaxID=660469 RepID=A0A9P5CQZ9_CRYP1|nr:NAD(P)-binding protein [Cryphonectria parasitica EP155]KAF3766610.1 NAD(P)-binding protein [Cryphonectria parasitica EP155]
MARCHVLLTGGNGFIAFYIGKALLESKFLVTVTVLRSRPFRYVIHAATPYHFDIVDPVADFIDPAVKGTLGILQSVIDVCPSVRRFVLLSSSATILNPSRHSKVYDETVFGTTTPEEAVSPKLCYRAAKIYAERAAFDFVEKHKPAFDLVVLNPPLVFGPAAPHLDSLQNLNTSNQRIRDMLQGKFRDMLAPTGPVYLFCDVRDVAAAHVRALSTPGAGGQRFLVVSGYFSNKRIADLIRRLYPGMASQMPPIDVADDMPHDVYGFDNTKSYKILGMEYRDLETCVGDSVRSFLEVGQRTSAGRNS